MLPPPYSVDYIEGVRIRRGIYEETRFIISLAVLNIVAGSLGCRFKRLLGPYRAGLRRDASLFSSLTYCSSVLPNLPHELYLVETTPCELRATSFLSGMRSSSAFAIN